GGELAGGAPIAWIRRTSATTSAPMSRTGSSDVRTRPPASASVIRRPSSLLSGPRGLEAGDGSPGRRRVLHREPRSPDAIERLQRAGHGGRGGDQRDLTDPLGPVRPFGLWLLHEDAFDGGHPNGGDDAERLERVGDR